jgi:hypothetical protein
VDVASKAISDAVGWGEDPQGVPVLYFSRRRYVEVIADAQRASNKLDEEMFAVGVNEVPATARESEFSQAPI